MKKILIVGLILISSMSTYSQFNAKNISFEGRYPIPVGDNFINKGMGDGYVGLIDLGVDYNVIRKNGFGTGILFNTSVLRMSATDVTLMIISPKIKVEYEIDLHKVSIIPLIGVGFSKWSYRGPELTVYDELGNQLHSEKIKVNNKGITIKGATKFVLNNDNPLKWFFIFSYEYTRLEKPDLQASDTKFNRNIQMVYPGFGVIWNFGK